ncbi:MAG: CDP-alcohol phosphatidyltransferase family protein [Anaerolineae bacterium]|nr:CDP-alcohol phosphatidyltransferase family protein [Anaerolineae bacterium]MDW8102721.1 CDP-alcohol phosphatidyltransferase family protein [Anaerolineae bacterium]
MLGELLREKTRKFVEEVARAIGATGITPNVLTIIGFLLTFPVALALALGKWLTAGVLLILAGLFDVIDGSVARVMGRVSRFGAFLDSTLDRLSEAVIYLGFAIYYLKSQNFTGSLLCYLTLVGSFMVSYTRARAEGLGVECREGLFTRFERLAVLALGLLIGKPLWALGLLALFSNLTAFQRIFLVRKALNGKGYRGPS